MGLLLLRVSMNSIDVFSNRCVWFRRWLEQVFSVTFHNHIIVHKQSTDETHFIAPLSSSAFGAHGPCDVTCVIRIVHLPQILRIRMCKFCMEYLHYTHLYTTISLVYPFAHTQCLAKCFGLSHHELYCIESIFPTSTCCICTCRNFNIRKTAPPTNRPPVETLFARPTPAVLAALSLCHGNPGTAATAAGLAVC